jgi:hypothetical protein
MSDGERNPRGCRDCGRVVCVNWPVVFITLSSGRMAGPFHPQCADSIIKYARVKSTITESGRQDGVVQVVQFDQKELPW